MFSLQIFTELLIVGAFLLLGILPLLMMVNERSGGKSEFWPLAGDFSSKVKIVIILLLTYAAGAAGNRLVDDFWEDVIQIGSEGKYERKLNEDLSRLATLPSRQALIDCSGYVAEKGDCIKVANMALRERSGATRDWLDNRRAYVRLMRAAALASILFVFSIGVYKLARRDSQRFRISHVALAGVFTALLTVAHWQADHKYWKRVYELYVALPPTLAESGR